MEPPLGPRGTIELKRHRACNLVPSLFVIDDDRYFITSKNMKQTAL